MKYKDIKTEVDERVRLGEIDLAHGQRICFAATDAVIHLYTLRHWDAASLVDSLANDTEEF